MPTWFGTPDARPAWGRLAWWACVLGALGTAAFTWSTMNVDRGPEEFSVLWDAWVYYGTNTLVVAVLVLRAFTSGALRGMWAFTAAGNTTWLLASFVFTFHDQNLDPYPVPSPSDLFYYAGYPLLYAGLTWAGRRQGSLLRSAWLDGLIAGLGVAAVTAAVLMAPIVDQSGASQATVAWNLVYPLADLMLIAFLIAAVAGRGLPRGPGSWVLAIGMSVYALGDALYVYVVTTGTYRPGTPLDSTWLAATALMAAAGWLPVGRATPSRGTHAARRARTGVMMPTTCVGAALAVILGDVAVDLPGPSVVLAAATLVVATARTALTVKEVERLHGSHLLARTDDLTDLPNRRALREHLDAVFAADTPTVMLLLDLDGFKEINDYHGHETGDALLVKVAGKLRSAVPEDAFVARLGGDEFAVVLTAHAHEATRLAHLLVTRLAEPLAVVGMTMQARASCGIAVAPTDATNRSDLLRAADIAMYHAKRNQLGVATRSDVVDPSAAGEESTVIELYDGILSGQLELHYQPILDPSGAEDPAAEALVRWRHPERGLLYPDAFIDLAVRSGLIGHLTHAVLDQALAQLADWRPAHPTLRVSVNITVSDLVDPTFPDTLTQLLHRHRLPGDLLTLEITEADRVNDLTTTQATIATLRQLGVRVAIDDFGVGYSSMSQLLAFTADEIKIDRSFVTALHADPRARAVIAATVQLGNALGIGVVAEGVEDAAELATVTGLGCRRVQGYLYARPMPADQLGEFLTQWRGQPRPAAEPSLTF